MVKGRGSIFFLESFFSSASFLQTIINQNFVEGITKREEQERPEHVAVK
jgi:hypothetical protein